MIDVYTIYYWYCNMQYNETHVGDRESLSQAMTFIEERGGHSLSAEDSNGETVFENDKFIKQQENSDETFTTY